MNLKEIEILFFDIGNVFVSDDPSGCYGYRSLYERLASEGVQMAVDEFFAKRTEHVRDGGNLWSFVASHVPPDEFNDFQKRVRAEMYSRWPEMSPEIPGMADALRSLSEHYRLGILANQPREVESLLEERDLLRYFEVHGVSDIVGFEKPDPRLFQWALDQAGVKPAQAMMIGDRVDNDIKPAKALGMKTLWLRLGYEGRGWTPKDEFEQCYAWSLGDVYFSDKEPTSPDEEPDMIATSPQHLLELLVPATGPAPRP